MRPAACTPSTVDTARLTLFLGRAEVVRVDRRELSRGRTIAVGVGALAAGILSRR